MAALIALTIGQLLLVLLFLKNLEALAGPLFAPSARQGEKSLLGQAQDPLLPDQENPLAMIFFAFTFLLFLIFAFFPNSVFESMPNFLQSFPQLAQ